jgi:hypothetical protein
LVVSHRDHGLLPSFSLLLTPKFYCKFLQLSNVTMFKAELLKQSCKHIDGTLRVCMNVSVGRFLLNVFRLCILLIRVVIAILVKPFAKICVIFVDVLHVKAVGTA